MPNRFTEAARNAKDATNKELANELAVISNFNRSQISQLLPSKKDKEAYLQLMAQVEADTSMDQKIAFLQDNIATAGKIAFTLLKTLL